MSSFNVYSTKSSAIVGTYEAASAEAAIDAAFRDAGYEGLSGYEAETGATSTLAAELA